MKSIDPLLWVISAIPYAVLAVYAALTEPPALLLFAFSATALHELGHFAALILFRAGEVGFDAAAFGFRITPRGRMLSHVEEATVALAGPAVNITATLLCLPFCKASDAAITFAAVNIILAALNLLPISGLDGARALSATLARCLSPDAAMAVTSCLSVALSSLGCFFGLFLLLRGVGGLYIFCLFFSLLLRVVFARTTPL